jgi:hypothetical protein
MSTNTYDKMQEYIEAVFIVFKTINTKAETQRDKRLKMIALTIYNYVRFMSNVYGINIKNIAEPEMINMIPIFEYISNRNIELYDFSKINVSDVDVNKKEDLERFVLSHIYYITQQKSI